MLEQADAPALALCAAQCGEREAEELLFLRRAPRRRAVGGVGRAFRTPSRSQSRLKLPALAGGAEVVRSAARARSTSGEGGPSSAGCGVSLEEEEGARAGRFRDRRHGLRVGPATAPDAARGGAARQQRAVLAGRHGERREERQARGPTGSAGWATGCLAG